MWYVKLTWHQIAIHEIIDLRSSMLLSCMTESVAGSSVAGFLPPRRGRYINVFL